MEPFIFPLSGDPASLDRLEWLVTNGIGGYASGTVSGVLTRSYHGLLVGALAPPLGRVVQWVKVVDRVRAASRWWTLSPDRAGPEGRLEPDDALSPVRFSLEGSIPVWDYEVAGAAMQKRLWMPPGENTAILQWSLAEGSTSLDLEARVLVQHRDFHDVMRGDERAFRIVRHVDGYVVHPPGAPTFSIRAEGLETVAAAPGWQRDDYHAVEAYRGLGALGDNYFAGSFRGTLSGGQTVSLVGGQGEGGPVDVAAAREARNASDAAALRIANIPKGSAPCERLVLAADQFIVRRRIAGSGRDGHSVIAGYHWFGDWGRDTMIALPGLTLATGRFDIARSILQTFAGFIDRGMLPNRFPDDLNSPEYNTVDATLWYFEALRAYLERSGDLSLIKTLYPLLAEVIEWHIRGTRYGIRVDPQDGLLRAGEEGVQLTWMDVKIDDWAVTPRTGKAVEINALWYSALRTMGAFSKALGYSEGSYNSLAERAGTSFERFWNPARGFCYDVIDIPGGGADPSLRPNQVIAASLFHCPMPAAMRKAVVDSCKDALLTPCGLRSLAPSETGYTGRYGGDRRTRDAAYHQGTVWGWLIGPFVTAHFRVYRDRQAALHMLEPLFDQLTTHGAGTLSEIFDGDPPHEPRGCIAQAWTVSEVLRCLQLLNDPRADP